VAATEPLLSPDEVAVFLGIPVKTLYQWRYKGVGPRGLRIGRHVRYRSADVEAWLREVEEKGQRGNVA
jgi:excisionase family DNA binding protein